MKLYPFLSACALFASGAWCYGRPQHAGPAHPGARPLVRSSGSALRPMWMGPQRMPTRPYVMYKAPSKGNIRYSKPFPTTTKYAALKSPPWKAPTRAAPSGPDPVQPLRTDFAFGGASSYTSISGSGPIHTIPAPNLSRARKPIIVADQSSQVAEYQPAGSNHKPAMKTTSYEVTEKFSEPISASDAYIHPMFLEALPQSMYLPHHVTLASPELLQLVRNAYQKMPETYGMPIFAQPQVLQHHSYVPQIPLKNYVQPNLAVSPNVLQPSILFKPEPAFIQQIQSQVYKFPGYPPSEHRGPQPESAAQTEIFQLDKKEEAQDPHKLHYNVVRETKEGSAKVQPFHPSKEISVFEIIKPNITNDGAVVTINSKDTVVAPNEDKDTIVGVNKWQDDTVEGNHILKAVELNIPNNNTVDVIIPKTYEESKKNPYEGAEPQPDVKKEKENLVEIKKTKDTAIDLESPKGPVKVTTLNENNKADNVKKNTATEKVKKVDLKNKDNSVFYSQIGDDVDNYIANGFYAALTEAKAAEAMAVDASAVKDSAETNDTKFRPDLLPYFVQNSAPKLNETSNEILKPVHGVPFAKSTIRSTPEPATTKSNETLSSNEDVSHDNLQASESTNPIISAVSNDSIQLLNLEKKEIVAEVTEPPPENEPLRLVLKADTMEPERTTQGYPNVTVDEKTGEPVIRIYASYKPKNEQKKDDTNYSIADTNMGAIKTIASSNAFYHDDWKSSGGYKFIPGTSLGSGINQISEFGLKLRPKLHDLETLIGMEK